MSAEASEMVSIPRAELDALKAEVRRLRREVGRSVALARIEADHGLGDDAPTFTREQLAEALKVRPWPPAWFGAAEGRTDDVATRSDAH